MAFFGAAHFIEHLVFKATRQRTAFEIAKSLEAVGGDLNAYTTREYTCFHGLTLSEHVGLSIEVLSDLMTNALFEKKDFENELQVILQEADMSKEQLDEWIYDLLFEAVYKGHPLNRSILGDRQSLIAMSRARLKKYYAEVYRGESIIVSVAGNVNHDEIVTKISKLLVIGESKKPTQFRGLSASATGFKKL